MDDCIDCRDWPGALAEARFAWILRPPADDLAHALKYEGWHELASYMGRCMAQVAGPAVPGTTVVPVPTTRRRLRQRGYNQAALLADVVAAELGLSTADALIRRVGETSQTELSPADRRENVRGVFTAGPGSTRVRDRTVLLVDDVLTTGATAGAAAISLQKLGAEAVRVVTFGRALPGREARTRSAA